MRVPAKIHLLHPLFSHEDDFSWRNYWHVLVLLMVSLLLFIHFTYTFLSLAYGQTLSPSAAALKQGILQPHESRSTSSVLPISTTDPLGKMAFSSDGQTIVFSSRQEDLVAGDSNGEADVFLYEPHKDLFSCVTCQINGLISNGRSLYPRISADGRRVVFLSYASNLVEDDEANTSDVFLYERSNHLIQRVSQKNERDSFEAELSANGQYVVYTVRMVSSIKNESDNKTHIMRVDLNTGKREVISSAINGIHSSLSASAPSTSADGNVIAFLTHIDGITTEDSKSKQDVYVYNASTNSVERVSAASDGSQANGDSWDAVVSSDGMRVAFTSYADNLVPGDTNGAMDVFLYELDTQLTKRISFMPDGNQATMMSARPQFTKDGEKVIFASLESRSSQLREGDGWVQYIYNIPKQSTYILSEENLDQRAF